MRMATCFSLSLGSVSADQQTLALKHSLAIYTCLLSHFPGLLGLPLQTRMLYFPLTSTALFNKQYFIYEGLVISGWSCFDV